MGSINDRKPESSFGEEPGDPGGTDGFGQAADRTADLKPLNRHEYPGWIKAASIVVIASVCYSLLSFPANLEAARNLRRAENLYEADRLLESMDSFGKVLKSHPSSEKARIGAAKALFRYGGEIPCSLGVLYLSGISLSEYQWEGITEVMPPEYDHEFQKESD
ncbi:MAG: hypothetical protein KC777_21075 [Cyanobacteria bacterium HKST-UBA02]|nr:hypothetical protein [Cyanobacteria bacterium HKST-UBA02]